MVASMLTLGSLAFAEDGADSDSTLEPGLTKPCERKEDNLQSVKTAMESTDSSAQGCRTVVEDGLKSCLNQSNEQLKLGQGAGGMKASIEATRSTYQQGVAMYAGYAKICLDQRDKVSQTCKRGIEGLRQARSNNLKDEAQDAQEIASLDPSSPERATRIQQHEEFKHVHQQLNSQIDAQGKLVQSATKALDDGKICFANQARIYTSAVQKTDSMLASLSTEGEGDETAGNSSSTSAVDSKAVPDDVKAARSLSAGTTDTLESKARGLAGRAANSSAVDKVAKVGEHGYGAFAIAKNVYDHDALNAGLNSAEYGVSVLAPRYALASTGVTTFLSVFLDPTVTSACDEMIYDPVRAYKTGCALRQPQSATANETAIQTLSHD